MRSPLKHVTKFETFFFEIIFQGPGLFFILPCIDDIITVDLRTITFDVPPQEILTRDSV